MHMKKIFQNRGIVLNIYSFRIQRDTYSCHNLSWSSFLVCAVGYICFSVLGTGVRDKIKKVKKRFLI
jgi:hypothetical protein